MSSRRRTTYGMLLLALSGSLLCAPLASAQTEVPPGRPLFGLPIVHADHLAVLALGSAADPGLGSLAVCSDLIAGTHPDVRVWEIQPLALSSQFQVSAGAGTAFLAGASSLGTGPLPSGLTLLATFRWGDVTDIWTLRDTTRVEPIPPLLLDLVQDSRGIPAAVSDDLELRAYFAFLAAAHRTPRSVLEKAARTDVTYAHLFTEPGKFRGQVVELRGQLRRIRKFEAPASARIAGIPYLYEGWIFYKTLGGNPFCVLFTELPKGLQVAEEMDIPVKFAGYFYKRYRYVPADQPAGRSDYKREAPLLIGHAPTPLGPGEIVAPGKEDTNWAKALLPIFVGGIIVTVVVGFVVLLWTRRADRTIKNRLAALRQRDELQLPPPDEEGPDHESGRVPA